MKKALSLAMALMMLISMVCAVPVMAAAADGSAKNPYPINFPKDAPEMITIPANGAVYYQYKAAVFAGWSVTGYGVTSITVDGVLYDQMNPWGEIEVPFNFKFMSPGIVGYFNDTDEDVDVKLTHNEPVGSESNPDELVEGENTFSIPSNNPSYVADYLPTASGEYTFECAQSDDFNITVEVDDTTYTLENGSLTLELESYIPVRVYISPVGNTSTVTITLTAPKAGTESNPIWLDADALDSTYAVSADEDTYFSVTGQLSGSTLIIETQNGAEFTALVDGEEYVSEGGALEVLLDTTEWYIELILTASADTEIAFSVDFAAGTMENPIELVDGDNEIAIPEGGYYYYTYTAEKDGLLVLTPADAAAFDLLDIGYEDADFNYHYGYLAEGASSALLVVPAGQTVTITACGVMDEETFTSNAVDTTLNVTVKDLLLYNTFEGVDLEGDLEGWSSTSDLVLEEAGEESNVANGFYSAEFNVTKDWGNIYRHATVEANTNYEVTFKAKAAISGNMWIKFHKEDWTGDIAEGSVSLTTEWAEHTTIINSGDNTEVWLLMQYAGYAADGQTIWLDDIVITKSEGSAPVQPDAPAETGEILNGDFSNNSGWTLGAGASIANGMLTLENIGAWSEAAMQTVSVKPNTNYEITWKSQCVSGSGVTYMTLMNASFGNYQVTSGQIWMTDTSGNWMDHTVVLNTGDNEVIIFKLTSEDGKNKIINIDDVTLTEIKDPSDDGFIKNGDFETGKILPWENLWGSNNVELVDGYNGGYALKAIAGGAWNHVRQTNIAVEPNTDYVIKLYAKNASAVSLLIKDGGDSVNIAQQGLSAGAEWTPITFEFNSGNNSSILVSFMSDEAGATYTVDDITMSEKVHASDDGYLVNGTFETGELAPWENLWNNSSVEFVTGHNSDYAIQVETGMYQHVRQTGISVEPYTDYVIQFWAKNANKINLLVKDNGDTTNIYNQAFSADSEWTLVTAIFNSGSYDSILVSFMGAEDGAYYTVDDVTIAKYEPVDPSFDGFIYNGDFETGAADPWNIYGESSVCADAAHSGSFGLKMISSGDWGGTGDQAFEMEAGKSYKVTLWIKTIENGVNIQIQDGGVNVAGEWINNASEWTQLTYEFTATSDSGNINFCGGGNGIATVVYVDDIVVKEMIDPSFDGYITNGDFETGEAFPWDNLWGNNTVEIVDGHNGGYALSIISGQWQHVRQTNIAVEPNTDYRITLWAKNTENMNLLIKDGADSMDIKNAGISAGSEWTEFVVEFNSGDNTSIIVSLMGGEGEGQKGIFDDIFMETYEADDIAYGDLTGDGEINNRDLVSIQQYLNGWDITVDEAAADVNGDGEINNRDLVLLQQYLNNWDVTLGK